MFHVKRWSGKPSARCRHTACWIGIAAADGDPVDAPAWRQEVSRWEGFDAGYLDPEHLQ